MQPFQSNFMSQLPIITSTPSAPIHKKIFPCQVEGCGKIFTKQVELMRHAIVHASSSSQAQPEVPQLNISTEDILNAHTQLSPMENVQPQWMLALEQLKRNIAIAQYTHQAKAAMFAKAQQQLKQKKVKIASAELSNREADNSDEEEEEEDMPQKMKMAVLENKILKKKLVVAQKMMGHFYQQIKIIKSFAAKKDECVRNPVNMQVLV